MPPKSKKADYKTTAEIEIPKKLADQVIGQDNGVELIRKAASQRRNVLLVGLPGTGKSMLAQAMAELLPVQKMQDILIYPNQIDPNTPKVVAVPAGEGQKIIDKAKLDVRQQEDSARLVGILLTVGWFIITYILYAFFHMHVNIYAATIVVGGFLLVALSFSRQVGLRMGGDVPKLLIDNKDKTTAPFMEATGARAGALLGDVRHDPLQCHLGFNNLYIQKGEDFVEKPFAALWSEMYEKYGKEIIRNEKGYEAIMLPSKEKIFTLGVKDGKIVLSRILSLNRQPFEGELVELNIGDKTIALTPEHEVNTAVSDKKAGEISQKDQLITLVKLELVKIFN